MAGEGVAAAVDDAGAAALVAAAAAGADVQAEGTGGVPAVTIVVPAGLVAVVPGAEDLQIPTVTRGGITSRLVCYSADSI